MILGGFGAPLFLLLAGVAVALSAGSKARRTGDPPRRRRSPCCGAGSRSSGLAFLFRVQAWILGWSSPLDAARVDILNIMGPSIVAAAALWGVLLAAAAARGSPSSARHARDDAADADRPALRRGSPGFRTRSRPTSVRPGSTAAFALFPWAGFVFAGGFVGALLDRRRRRSGARTRAEYLARRRRRRCSRSPRTPGRSCPRSTPARTSGRRRPPSS